MKLLSLIGCGVLLASLTGTCLANGDEGATTVPQILQMQHALRAKLESPSGEYSRFTESDIRKMEAAQDNVFHILDGVTSLDQLNDVKKTELSNSLDQVKAAYELLPAADRAALRGVTLVRDEHGPPAGPGQVLLGFAHSGPRKVLSIAMGGRSPSSNAAARAAWTASTSTSALVGFAGLSR